LSSNELEIKNHKSITNNDPTINTFNSSLSFAGLEKDQLNDVLDAIKNLK
tara:strand:+ start:313 stop:462 length:150 start_codon:yes stop_codon:yes gene_type:complete